MKPPILDRVRKEDIPDSPEWMDRVLYILNRFLESVVLLFTKNITFEDNIDSQDYKDVINQAALTAGYKIKVTTKKEPTSVELLNLVKTTERFTTFTEAPWVGWEYQVTENRERVIVIHYILGITSGVDYNITLRIK
jgi:hypothetical protein